MNKKKVVVTTVAGILTVFCIGCGVSKIAEEGVSAEPTQIPVPSISMENLPLDEDNPYEVEDRYLTITPEPTGDAKGEVGDGEGNLSLGGEDWELPEEPSLAPTPTEEPEPTPTEVPKPTEEPSLAPTPTEEPEPTPTEVPKPTEKPKEEAKPTKAPTSTPKPTEKPAQEDPTGLKPGQATGNVIVNKNGDEIKVIHHSVGDIVVASEDGLERGATYRLVDKKTREFELLCWGKYEGEWQKVIIYVDTSGTSMGYREGGAWVIAEGAAESWCTPYKEPVIHTDDGTGGSAGGGFN